MNVRFSPFKITTALLTCTALLAGTHLILQTVRLVSGHNYIFGLLPLFDLDLENNIPTLFSFTLFLIIAALTAFIASDSHHRRDPLAAHWSGLWVIFLWLGLDEMLSIHELWSIRIILDNVTLYFWHFLYMIIFLIVGLFYIRFFQAIDTELRKRMILAAGIYLTAVVVLEFFSSSWNIAHQKIFNAPYMLMVTVEETLEMTGLIALIYGLLKHIRTHIKTATVTFE